MGWLEKKIKRRLRRFYALWCLREAYVKMTGEALLAEWLQELEFRSYPVPHQVTMSEGWAETQIMDPQQQDDEEGFEVYFKGERVQNVGMRIVGEGSKYMVAMAVRRKDGKAVEVQWSPLQKLTVEDVVRRCKEACGPVRG